LKRSLPLSQSVLDVAEKLAPALVGIRDDEFEVATATNVEEAKKDSGSGLHILNRNEWSQALYKTEEVLSVCVLNAESIMINLK
jgi:hypothetical protein